MVHPIDVAERHAKVSLTSYSLCQLKAAVMNVVPGSQIRPVSRTGVTKLKKCIEWDGFAKHSLLYVVEQPVSSLDPLDVIVRSFTRPVFIPEGTSICTLGEDGYVAITEPPEIKALRRYWTLDGGHRLKARLDLLAEATSKGDKAGMLKHVSISVIVLHGMSKSQLPCLAAKLNTANGSDFVKTTNLHKYTVLRKQVQYYAEEELVRLKESVKVATAEGDIDKLAVATAQLQKFEVGGVVVRDFCDRQYQQINKFGQTMKGVYGIEMNNFGLYVGLAMRFSQSLALKIQAIYDDEVS